MVDVDEYIKSAAGNWLKAIHVQAGDKLLILDEGIIDDKSFDRAYVVMQVKLQRTGEDYSLRLGPKNTKRIRDSFGTPKTAEWKGHLLEVISIETYSGLGQKGMLLHGVPGEARQAPLKATTGLSQSTLGFLKEQRKLVEAGFEMGLPLNESEFNMLPFGVKAELLKYGCVRKTEQGFFFTEKCKQYIK